MDWYVDTSRPDAVNAVQGEIRAFLGRHAADVDKVAEAEMVVSELIGNVVHHAVGPAWVSLVWTSPHPELVIYDLGPGFALDAAAPGPAGRGRTRPLHR